jgi:hypothetical protein
MFDAKTAMSVRAGNKKNGAFHFHKLRNSFLYSVRQEMSGPTRYISPKGGCSDLDQIERLSHGSEIEPATPRRSSRIKLTIIDRYQDGQKGLLLNCHYRQSESRN